KNMPVRMTGTHQNITLQKKQNEALASVQQQLHETVDHERTFLQSVIDGAGDPVMAIDVRYNILLMNLAASRLTQDSVDAVDALGKKCYQLFHGSDRPCSDSNFPCPIKEVLEKDKRATLVHNPFHGNSINNTFEIEVTPLRGKNGEMYGIIEVARDVTDRLRIEKELRESQSRLYRLAHHDTLTGLPNRLLFRDRLDRAIIKARRNKTRVAILFLDLDYFKAINDSLGHDVGDELLIEVAGRLQNQCRQSDTVARLGGDEFVFILDDISNGEDAAIVATKIMDALRRPIEVNGHTLNITTSIGIGIYPDDFDTIDGVIKCADTALYQVKDEGRSNFKFYRPEMRLRANRLLFQEKQLREAIRGQQFFMEYQPQYDVRSGNLVGLEALLRWDHPEDGTVLPNEFIHIAEQSGLIVDIGELILREVCDRQASWQREGLVVVPVGINMSSRQFQDPEFLTMVSRTVQISGLSPALLEIELTEGTVMADADRSLGELEQIARFGISLAVDDFGVGRSSLALLQRLPLDRLKIDGSFIAEVHSDRNMSILVDAIIVLAHSLGLTVLAEGVENKKQLQFLEKHQCDQVQGFYFSQPMGADEVKKLLTAK
ncbi:MAG: EAL domain-containing protein, partial [Desulfobulbaceae bacterium]|nr:EAL domain-containing protein [Desulfobulbaceae bacterium]